MYLVNPEVELQEDGVTNGRLKFRAARLDVPAKEGKQGRGLFISRVVLERKINTQTLTMRKTWSPPFRIPERFLRIRGRLIHIRQRDPPTRLSDKMLLQCYVVSKRPMVGRTFDGRYTTSTLGSSAASMYSVLGNVLNRWAH